MGRKLHYVPGSFYRTDDRTGFPQRAEQTRKQWDGLIVDENVWEARQPQDLVKGVPDNQSVPDARPLGSNVFVGPISTQTTANASIGATSLTVQGTAGFAGGSKVGVITDFDNGAVFFTHVNGTPSSATALPLTDALPYPVSSGNTVTLYRASPGVEPGLP